MLTRVPVPGNLFFKQKNRGKKMEIDLSQVRARGNFQKYVLFLANGRAMTTRSLEEYLRALWGEDKVA
jgi:hypothetical protein